MLSYYWVLIGSHICRVDWHNTGWPWVTLNGSFTSSASRVISALAELLVISYNESDDVSSSDCWVKWWTVWQTPQWVVRVWWMSLNSIWPALMWTTPLPCVTCECSSDLQPVRHLLSSTPWPFQLPLPPHRTTLLSSSEVRSTVWSCTGWAKK